MKLIFTKKFGLFLIYLSIGLVMVGTFGMQRAMKTVMASQRNIPILCVQTPAGKVALTYNINSVESVDKILKATQGERVTFFADSNTFMNHPSEIKKITDSGNEIALLERNLKGKTKSEIYDRIACEIEITGRELAKSIEVFRFDNNLYDNNTVKAVFSLGLYPVQWSATGKENNFSAGDIILITDDTDIKKLLNSIKKDGCETATVSEILIKNEYKVDINGEMMPK